MPGYFYCHCCGKRVRKNPRLKIQQNYCGCKRCQQSRKNAWEKQKRKEDPLFKEERNKQKAHWRKERPGHQYQREYRHKHHPYAKTNRQKQLLRNKKASKSAFESHLQKIVKTDALNAGSLIRCGLYKIVPVGTCPGKKIVKTDAIILEILAHIGFQKVLVPKTD
jgi:hypothetical protein